MGLGSGSEPGPGLDVEERDPGRRETVPLGEAGGAGEEARLDAPG